VAALATTTALAQLFAEFLLMMAWVQQSLQTSLARSTMQALSQRRRHSSTHETLAAARHRYAAGCTYPLLILKTHVQQHLISAAQSTHHADDALRSDSDSTTKSVTQLVEHHTPARTRRLFTTGAHTWILDSRGDLKRFVHRNAETTEDVVVELPLSL
jgi:hypothetical protein